MNQDKMQLINKIFNQETIRTIWDKEDEKYYISIVDIVSVITESKDGRKYWNKLKQRLKEEGNESVTNCHQLKLNSRVRHIMLHMKDNKNKLNHGIFTIRPEKLLELVKKQMREENRRIGYMTDIYVINIEGCGIAG